MTIYDDMKAHHGRYRKFKGQIGLEIETEAVKLYEVPALTFWSPRGDNSLRGPHPMEYVLNRPVEYPGEFRAALSEFAEKTKHAQFDQDSITTSNHVHLNVLNEKWVTLGTFLTIYTLFENILVRFAGENRFSNCYCLPMVDAEQTYYNILDLFEKVQARRFADIYFDAENNKYAALNLEPITRFGSIEQRSMRGTTDIALIDKWVSMLYSIMEYAKSTGITPLDFLAIWKERGLEVLSDVFGPYRAELRRPDEDILIEKNFWYATTIATRPKNWLTLDVEPLPKIDIPKVMDEISQKMFKCPFEELNAESQRLVLLEVQNIKKSGILKKKAKVAIPEPGRVEGLWIPRRDEPPIMGGINVHPAPPIDWNEIEIAERAAFEPDGEF